MNREKHDDENPAPISISRTPAIFAGFPGGVEGVERCMGRQFQVEVRMLTWRDCRRLGQVLTAKHYRQARRHHVNPYHQSYNCPVRDGPARHQYESQAELYEADDKQPAPGDAF